MTTKKENSEEVFEIFERIIFLKGVELFKNVDVEKLKYIAEIAREIKISKNDIIAVEGENAESIFIVKDGVLKITKKRNGKNFVLAEITEGSCFGDIGLFHDSPRDAGAIAKVDTTIIEIRKNDFSRVLMANTAIAINLLGILGERVKRLNDKILLLKNETEY